MTSASCFGPLGLFQHRSDIGPVRSAGSASFDPQTQEYTLSGSGKNMWLQSDEFCMVWKKLKGDFILRARVRFVGQGVDPHRKIGVIVRSSLKPESAYADVAIHGDGLTSLQYRPQDGAQTQELRAPIRHADVVQLSRVGGRYLMRVAKFGDVFTDEQPLDLDLGDEVHVGLFITSHNPDVVESAIFSEVRVIVPPKQGYVPYRDYIGSNLEILDTQTGQSCIVYQTPDCIEAPNWTPDGKALIYNSKGRLYRFDLASGTPTLIDTGFATRNNNDHVLSFDGTMLGISHHSQEQGKSIVYVVPVAGGIPRQITTVGPSYLHGWSPDGKTLVYTAERGNDNYDIYSIPVAGGYETRLTTAPGLDDGSEFSPDGNYIYFNSVRSGLMQLWRMRPDGSAQEQVTANDSFNNWFPHISPDGKMILFLSYGQDVKPGNHPYYKHVYLRTMPAAGGSPRVVAYLFGGQGTMNVPSWSPDGRHAAFVSHSD